MHELSADLGPRAGTPRGFDWQKRCGPSGRLVAGDGCICRPPEGRDVKIFPVHTSDDVAVLAPPGREGLTAPVSLARTVLPRLCTVPRVLWPSRTTLVPHRCTHRPCITEVTNEDTELPSFGPSPALDDFEPSLRAEDRPAEAVDRPAEAVGRPAEAVGHPAEVAHCPLSAPGMRDDVELSDF